MAALTRVKYGPSTLPIATETGLVCACDLEETPCKPITQISAKEHIVRGQAFMMA